MRSLLIIPMKSQKGAERKKTILEIVAENPTITQTQLMEEMNLTRKQVQKDMKELHKKMYNTVEICLCKTTNLIL